MLVSVKIKKVVTTYCYEVVEARSVEAAIMQVNSTIQTLDLKDEEEVSCESEAIDGYEIHFE